MFPERKDHGKRGNEKKRNIPRDDPGACEHMHNDISPVVQLAIPHDE